MSDDLIKRVLLSGGLNLAEAVRDRIEQLERELDEARHLQSCACNYDTPTDVCMGHHALFERLYAAERGKLEAKLAKAMRTIKRTAEQLDWCQAARDIRKELDVVLAELEVKE